MKHLKMLGLAAVAAVSVMAMAGVATASAETTLCKTNETPCAAANHYASGTSITATNSGNAVLKTSGGFINPTVTCTKSTVGGKTTATGGSPLPGEISSFTFSGCSWSGGTCTVKAVNLNYKASIENTPGTMNGTFNVKNGGKGEPGASVECEGISLVCTYTKEVSLEAEGGAPAKVYAKEEALHVTGGFGCPTEAHWTATYTVSPSPLWLAQS